MPENGYLLDTNAAIDLLNRSKLIAAQLANTPMPSLPLVALGELEFGARKSANPAKNLTALDGLLKEVSLILPDRKTAAVYGEIELGLRQRGRPIPSNDIWIAATALQHGLVLLTRDSHFDEVQGLSLASW